MFAILVELERDIIVERTKAGLESARRRGNILSKPHGLNDDAKRKVELCAYYFNPDSALELGDGTGKHKKS